MKLCAFFQTNILPIVLLFRKVKAIRETHCILIFVYYEKIYWQVENLALFSRDIPNKL
jgi:hypothetical protein